MKKPPQKAEFPTPNHLKTATKRWFEAVVQEFVLDEHHLKILSLAATNWDRAEDARAAIAKHGLTFEDRFGAPHARPEVKIANDATIVFSRLIRELGLDVAPPDDVRPPRMSGRK